jgi:SSS family solute:Na+ symporter
MNMFLPQTDSVLPWTALMLGLWIPNFYYWGLNQYITQRTLGSASLAQGQRGIVFAAFMKLLIPFVIVIPGIIAFNLYSTDMQLEAAGDKATALTKYLRANPQTRFVESGPAPTAEGVAAWPQGRYLIALYPDEKAILDARVRNPFVLPITQARQSQLTVAPFTVFETEDHAWRHVNAELAQELGEFNQRVRDAATKAGQKPAVEKLIAYKYDTALAQLLGNVLPQGTGLVGFVLAALLGAVVSSLAAMLNAASTIFSMDVFKKFVNPEATQGRVVFIGRVAVVAFAIVAVLLAPQLGNPKISNSIFTIIQAGQGFISPGILAVFAFGLIVRRAPRGCGTAGLVTNMIAYGFLMLFVPSVQFLNAMALCFALCLAVMGFMTWKNPLPKPIEFKHTTTIALESCGAAKLAGIAVVAVTLVFYLVFSPLGIAR